MDGFIAHKDGSFDGFEWDDEVASDFIADQKQYGTVLMGRKTYEAGLKEGKTSPYPEMHQVVFSRTMKQSHDATVELVESDPVSYVKELKSKAERPIWLCGGSKLATQLLESRLLDKVVVKLNPVVFGSGISLFGATKQHTSLKLEDKKIYTCDIILITYRVS